jgi:hypothetical protein
MTPVTYLAGPYSDPDPIVRRLRFDALNRAAGQLMAAGVLVYSPISHSNPIALAWDLPTGWDWWQRQDMAMLERCQRLVVLTLDGWRDSVGVQAEIRAARFLGIQEEYMPWP